MSDSSITIDDTNTNDGQSSDGLPMCKMKMPTTLTDSENAFYKSLLDFIENGDDKDFLIAYSSTDLLKNYNDIQIKLFIKAIEKNSSEDVVEKILCNVTDIEYIREIGMGMKYNTSIIEDVCGAGNLEAFRKLLTLKHLKLPTAMEILRTIISSLDEDLFNLWFDILYDFDKFDVNEDDGKVTLLDKAISLGKKTVVRKLLEAGTYIGIESYFNERKSTHKFILESDVIKECFDSCIEGELHSHKYITYNYKNLVPPKSHRDLNEMAPIMLIVNSKEHLNLIKHPLITSFMAVKWQRYSKLLYLNLLCYCFYLISILWYIALTTGNEKESDLTNLTWWFTIFGTAYLIIREAIQLKFSKEYLKKISNYLELVLIIFSILIIITIKSLKKEIIVCGIIIIAIEFWVLVGNLPILSFSTHMLMLEEVLKTFLKSFSLYAVFVLTFALSFFVLYGPKNKFENVFKSVVKTMAMVVGELNFEDLKLTDDGSYILFLLFIICMTVVLMNLLNGLAVSDIQVIRQHAELNELICRAKFLYNNDSKILFPEQYDEDKNEERHNRPCNCKNNVFVSGVYLTDKVLSNKIILPHKCLLCHIIDEKNTNENKTNPLWIFCGLFEATHFWQTFDFWVGNGTVMGSSIEEAKTVISRTKGNVQSIEKNKLEILELTVGNIQNKAEHMVEKVLHIYKESFIIEKQVQSIEEKIKNIEKEQHNIGKNVEKILKNMQTIGILNDTF